MKRNILIGIVLIVLPLQVFARSDGGLAGDIFVLWSPGGRSFAMGGGMAGLADDASAAYFNPAGLVQIERHELTLMHSIMFGGDMTMNVLSYAFPTRAAGSFGITLLGMYSSEIDGWDETRMPAASFRYGSMALLLSYAREVRNWLSFGLSYKLLYEQMLRQSGYGQGLDAGIFLFSGGKLSMGITGINLVQPTWTLDTEKQRAPIGARIGLSARPYRDKIAICIEGFISEHRSFLFSGGLEYRPFYSFALRAGADQYKVTYGIGIWRDMGARYTLRLDYAGAIHHESLGKLGPVHNISLSFEFGGFRARAIASKPIFSPIGEGRDNIVWLVLDSAVRGEVRNWEVLIRDVFGTTVRRLGAFGPPPHRVAWNGKDNNGIIVGDGDYYYEFIVIEERTGKRYEWGGKLASLHTVGPLGTVVMTPMGMRPELIKEEIREEGERDAPAPPPPVIEEEEEEEE